MKNSFSLEKVFALSRFESERFWEWPIQEVTIYPRGNQATFFRDERGDPKNDFCLGCMRNHGDSLNHRMVDVQYEAQGS